uniref:C8orf76 homolog n=1 Tax=Caligus clemensi TaxID=344056 RepID=C1C1P1_CALCM|nr:C8orf76 homolog [Caligus clemensi]
MDLSFNFSDEDFIAEEDLKRSKKGLTCSSYEARLDTPEWFFLSNEEVNPKLILNRLKFRGDYDYARKQMDEAISEYLALLDAMREGKGNLPLKREVLESLSRSYLKTNKPNGGEEALKYALLFHSTSNPVNPCNLFASFDLLTLVYLFLGNQPQMAHYCIIQMLHHRPLTPRVWGLLGDSYSTKDDTKAAASWLRAIGLYESVNKTVGPIVKEQNGKFIDALKNKVEGKELDEGLLSDLRRQMTKDLVNEIGEQRGEDFQDLGASKRMKPLEEGIQSPPPDDDSMRDFDINWDLVVAFEKKWFSF